MFFFEFEISQNFEELEKRKMEAIIIKNHKLYPIFYYLRKLFTTFIFWFRTFYLHNNFFLLDLIIMFIL